MISIHAENVLLDAFRPLGMSWRPVDEISHRLKREETRKIFDALVEYYEDTQKQKTKTA